ncbi:UNC93-like protein [Araneus ventricosus]|uniref:UNC93-like protein n=1 Tax=Araneus ventricosus TaxID=182803 RepID=A0A4Y2WIF4_ARAVE|nr:UNC93-like protein [Araneus ventricosus]
MNKEEGVGTISMAISFISYGFASLLFTSFLVKKFGSKHAQILGIIMMLPYIASNVYPTWFTMFPAALLRGIGASLLWAAQCTYFNESSVLFCAIEKNGRKSKHSSYITPEHKNSDVDKEINAVKSDEQNVEQLSAFDLFSKTGNNPALNSKSSKYQMNASPVRLTAYRHQKDDSSENKLSSKGKSTEITKEIKGHNMKIFNDAAFSKTQKNVSNERKEEILLDSFLENVKESDEDAEYQSYVDSTKSFFFGIHGVAYHSAAVWSSLICYYVLKTGDKEDYNNTSSHSCGASFCSANEEGVKNSIEEVPDETRYLLIGVCMAIGFAAPLLLLLFLDRIVKTEKDVKLSWDHVFATIKYIKKKDQLLLIPFTIGVALCRGFYITDFTKSYIACAWSISHIGLITAIYGASSALSSIFSGVIIKYVGRISVIVLCQIVTIANYVFLFFWIPDAHQPYMFYIQASILGMITAVLVTQTKAFYGILFEGDEETAFSSCNLYTSIGWALLFIYNDFFCTSVKICIVLTFSCIGLLGYLLAERSYSLRNKPTHSS